MTEDARPAMPHNLIMEDRRLLTVTGVSDVDSFDERSITVFTDMGELTITGSCLHINKLCVETGELSVEGKISVLSYSEEQRRETGFFSRMFR